MTTPSDGIGVDIDVLVAIDVFVETSVFVAVSVLDDIHHADAVRVLDAAVRNGCRLITTYAVILELMGAVRKKVITSHKRQSGSEEERAGVEASADVAVARAIKIIYNMVRRGVLKIVMVKGKSHDYFGLCGKALVHSGHAVYVADNRAYRHKGIGPFDLIHYASAEGANAAVIITSDAAFADIEGNDDEFGHIKVQLTGGPLIDLLGGGDGGGQPS